MKKNKILRTVLSEPLLTRIGIPVLCVILALSVSLLVLQYKSKRADTGPRVIRTVSLFIETPPEWAKDNAAYYYQKAYGQLLELFKSDRSGLSRKELLDQAQPSLDLFSQGTAIPRCDFSFGGKMPLNNTFRRAISRVYLCEIVLLKADALVETGRVEEALELYRKFFVYLTHLSRQLNAVNAVELMQDKKFLFGKLKRLIESGRLSAEETERLLSLLEDQEREETPFSFTIKMIRDVRRKAVRDAVPPEVYSRYKAMSDEYFTLVLDAIDSASPDKIALAEAQNAAVSSPDPEAVRVSNELLQRSHIERELLARYVKEQNDRAKAERKRDRKRRGRPAGRNAGVSATAKIYDEIAGALLSTASLNVLYRDYFTSVAQWRLLKTALAARLYKAEYKSYPDGVDKLVPGFLDAVPGDPYGTGTFSLAERGRGVVVSSAKSETGGEGNSLEIVLR